ncbi:MAG: hypothetical protein LC792_06585, partial [Actinobacteria bacterium]|nr:hypothetical protein [Actinomycetota bacterium]
AAAVLGAIAGIDPADPVTSGSAGHVPAGGYLPALKPGALKGVRLGVPSPGNRPGGDSGALLAAALADLQRAGAVLVNTDSLGTTGLVGIGEIGLIPNEFKWWTFALLGGSGRLGRGLFLVGFVTWAGGRCGVARLV